MRDYFGNLKDGVIVFKQPDKRESKKDGNEQSSAATSDCPFGNEVLF